ncbi:hypothetical protein [Caedibacter taeniospiralis]|uniref:hypothetical protein n=1 Tax=Caedibacter taeniospiralis TaxID=28907 RepID=UPI000C27F49E|nr:hypothetical protein [Caedibacter taeniospiralis]
MSEHKEKKNASALTAKENERYQVNIIADMAAYVALQETLKSTSGLVQDGLSAQSGNNWHNLTPAQISQAQIARNKTYPDNMFNTDSGDAQDNTNTPKK